MKSKALKRKHKLELPYWPSAEFMRKSLEMLRQKGMQGSDSELEDKIKRAYWKKRAELLANEEIKKYEKRT